MSTYREYWNISEPVFFPKSSHRGDAIFLASEPSVPLEKLVESSPRSPQICLISGDNGLGKSTLAQYLYRSVQVPTRDIVLIDVTTPQQETGWLFSSLQHVLSGTQPDAKNQTSVVLRGLEVFLTVAGALTLILDSAENLHGAALADIETILDTASRMSGSLTIILVGRSELTSALKLHSSLSARVAHEWELSPLSKGDSDQYVRWHLDNSGIDPGVFLEDALSLIYQHTQGNPSAINDMGEKCLIASFKADRTAIDTNIVKSVLKSLDVVSK